MSHSHLFCYIFSYSLMPFPTPPSLNRFVMQWKWSLLSLYHITNRKSNPIFFMKFNLDSICSPFSKDEHDQSCCSFVSPPVTLVSAQVTLLELNCLYYAIWLQDYYYSTEQLSYKICSSGVKIGNLSNIAWLVLVGC
jgi:hypothetical protein